MKIIDVSYHNGAINFEKVKADGIDGVIIRAGYGRGNIDKKFHDYIEACNRLKIPVGIYWFSYAYSVGMARNEAQYCLNAIRKYKIDLPVFFDWEYDSMVHAKRHNVNPGKGLITLMNAAFCKVIAAAGYKAGFYFNLDYARHLIDVRAVGPYVTWYARYASAPAYDCDLWQYTSGGHVSGIAGRVDMNKVINKAAFVAEKPKADSAKKKSNRVVVDLLGGVSMPKLKEGSKGKAVRIWQEILGVDVDGIFGPKTEAATKKLQKKHGINDTGIVGEKTWKAGLESLK